MTPLQKLELEQSELRAKLAGILEKDEKSDDDHAELEKLSKRMQAVGIEYRASLLAQPGKQAGE